MRTDTIWAGELIPHSDDSTATFRPGEVDKAQTWALEYYRAAATRPDDETLDRIRAALKAG